MWNTSAPAVTAEWLCTKCSATNRKLTVPGSTEVKDRCMSCHTKHVVRIDDRPVRWLAEAA